VERPQKFKKKKEPAMKLSHLGLGAVVCALCAAPALAQVPPPEPCLCLKQAVDESFADMHAKQEGLKAAEAQLHELDAQLAAARDHEDVTNPQSVAQFRQLLAQRDAAFRESSGEVLTVNQAATARYNQAVAAYNGQCAGRPLPPPPPGPLACPRMP
jgi:ABC-type transporter MlaC component